MSELSFAKSFLATLDSRAIKLQPDHAADLKTLELKGPYTLPRYSSSPTMQQPSSTSTSTSSAAANTSSSSPSSPNAITITLRSLKNPPLNLSLPAQQLTTSIHALKQRIAQEINRDSTEGIKILYQRKPCSDAKTVAEVVGDEGKEKGEVEFGVMVVGGVAVAATGADKGSAAGGEDVKMEDGKGEDAPVAQGQSGEEVLGSAEFWDDLKGWLMQRVRDEGKAEEAWSLFKRGWDER
ncbi:MAG: hypothetical protein Q9169_008674 [Polycauliona sp. 2 TL-2023]